MEAEKQDMPPGVQEKARLDVLVVEPDEAERSSLVKCFAGTGTVAYGVAGAREARILLEKAQVHCVVVEAEMDSMNGIELLKLVRRKPALFDIPVIVLLQARDELAMKYALEERADAVLVKPLRPEDLQRAVREVGEQRQGRSEEEKKLIRLRSLQLQGEYAGAESLAKEILAEGDSPEALYALCKIYYHEKEHAKAKRLLEKLLPLNRTSKTLHLLSKVCRAEDECGDALVHLATANRQNPVNTDLKIDLGKLYLAMGMTEEAGRIFQEVVAARTSDLTFIKIGKAYLKAGDLQEAAAYLDRAVHPIAETAFIFQMYADALARAGRFDESIAQYTRSLKLQPSQPSCLYNLALTHRKSGNREQAEKVLQFMVTRYPDHAKAKEALSSLSAAPAQ